MSNCPTLGIINKCVKYEGDFVHHQMFAVKAQSTTNDAFFLLLGVNWFILKEVKWHSSDLSKYPLLLLRCWKCTDNFSKHFLLT